MRERKREKYREERDIYRERFAKEPFWPVFSMLFTLLEVFFLQVTISIIVVKCTENFIL